MEADVNPLGKFCFYIALENTFTFRLRYKNLKLNKNRIEIQLFS